MKTDATAIRRRANAVATWWIACGALVTWVAPGSAKELWERDWNEVRSSHFVFVSALDESRTRELVRDLEHFRQAAEIVTNIGRFDERITTTVYVFPSRVREFGIADGTLGYFAPRMRENLAAVSSISGIELDNVIKHEYLHFLIHNRDSLRYPPWFDEGFAEVMETLETEGRRVTYGEPDASRIASLNSHAWMSFNKLIETRSTQQLDGATRSLFYAQSWLLTHYLMFGRPERTFAADNVAYLRRVENGEPGVAAFEAAFGVRVSRLRRTLERYGARRLRVVALNLTTPLIEVDAVARALAPDEIAARLGALLLARGDESGAKRHFDGALALNPSNAKAIVGSAEILTHERNFDAAAPLYEKAIVIEPANAHHELDYGKHFLTRAALEADDGRRRELVREARKHFSRSYKIDPNNPETLARNGLSYLIEGANLDRGIESLEAAHEMLPSNGDIRADLARMYIEVGKPEKAREHLSTIVAWEGMESIEDLLGRLPPEPETPTANDPALAGE